MRADSISDGCEGMQGRSTGGLAHLEVRRTSKEDRGVTTADGKTRLREKEGGNGQTVLKSLLHKGGSQAVLAALCGQNVQHYPVFCSP